MKPQLTKPPKQTNETTPNLFSFFLNIDPQQVIGSSTTTLEPNLNNTILPSPCSHDHLAAAQGTQTLERLIEVFRESVDMAHQ